MIFSIYLLFKIIGTWSKIPEFKLKIYFRKVVSVFEYDILIGQM